MRGELVHLDVARARQVPGLELVVGRRTSISVATPRLDQLDGVARAPRACSPISSVSASSAHRASIITICAPPNRPQGVCEQMPEAVIVDAVRSPIGRAFKGSLAQLRPEETAAFIVDQLLERNPDVSPELIEDVYCGCGMPQGLQGFNVARIIVAALRAAAAGGHRDDDLALLRLVARRDPPRRERDQGRRGRRLRRRRGRVRQPLQRGAPSPPASPTATRT